MCRSILNILRSVVGVMVIALCVACAGCIKDEHYTYEDSTKIRVGDFAPDFTVRLVGGGEVSLSSCRGEVVMLILFSPECPDCHNQFAEMQRLIAEQAPSFRLLAVARDGDMATATQFCEKYDIGFEVGIDPDRKIYDKYARQYVPRTYLISEDGRVEALTIEFDADELHAIWAMAESMAQK